MDRIVKFEHRGDQVVAIDEAGRRFVTPAGRFLWEPLLDPAPIAEAPVEPALAAAAPIEPTPAELVEPEQRRGRRIFKQR